jgi:exonuclease SbcD
MTSSIKILHSADWHPRADGMLAGKTAIDPDTGLSKTLTDFSKSLQWIYNTIKEEQVDLVLLAGDIFDSAKPTTDELNAVFRFLKICSEVVPTIVIAGNHDLAQNGAASPAISPASWIPGPRIITRPETLELLILGSRFRIDCLPYPSRGRLLAAMGRDVLRSPEAVNGAINENLERILRGFTLAHHSDDDVRILLAHGSVQGATVNDQPRSLAHDVQIPLPDANADTYALIALGHIHQPQRLPGPPAFYSGSLLRQSFGEEKEEKGVWIYTLGKEGLEVASFFHNPHARNYITIPVEELESWPLPVETRETVYRIKGEVTKERWEELRAPMILWTEAVPYLQTDVEITREDRVRDKQINADMTPDDALDRTLEREAILDPLASLIRETHHSLTHEVTT